MVTTTRMLGDLGTILLIVGVAYRAGGWRSLWRQMKQPFSTPCPIDPHYWWATPLAVLGLALSLLGSWRSWRGL